MDMYKQICDKLGFEPKNMKIEIHNDEVDETYNPFDVLSKEELQYLIDNDLLR